MPLEQKCFDNIGKLIKTKRAEHPKELSQLDVSRLLGYKNGQFMSNVERGLCGVPLKKLTLLCDTLSISKGELLAALRADFETEVLKHL